MSIISLQEIMLVVSAAVIIISYHTHLYKKVRRDPLKTAIGITNHARQMWVKGIMSGQRDILAIQTLRNQVMAATFLAFTAILISLGSFGAAFRPGVFSETSHALNLLGTKNETLWMFKMMLLGIIFFFTFFNFTLAIRNNNHAGFMINTFEDKYATVSEEAVTQVVNHGALHYTIGMSPVSVKKFILLNAAGALVWAVAVATGGYLFGRALEVFIGKPKSYEIYIMGGIAIIGLLIWIFHFYSRRRRRDKLVAKNG